MTQEAAVPPGFWGRVQKMIDDRIADFARSGFLRNASITGGAGLTIKDGGRLALETAAGVVLFEIGPVGPALPDGTPQQGWVVRRADGSGVLDLFDVDTSDGVLRQALNWRDRSGNVVLADDTDSGQGLARPYLPGVFSRARYADWSVSTTSGSFETLWRAEVYHQQPRLSVAVNASMDTAATTGEIQVLVNGTQLAPSQAVTFSLSTLLFGPAPVQATHMSLLSVEIRGRRTSASGALRVEPLHLHGRQT